VVNINTTNKHLLVDPSAIFHSSIAVVEYAGLPLFSKKYESENYLAYIVEFTFKSLSSSEISRFSLVAYKITL